MSPAHHSVPSIEVTASSPTKAHPPSHAIRPTSSRNLSSSSSLRSNGSSRSRRPHRQQHDYVSSGMATSAYVGGETSEMNGFDERWQFEQAEEEGEGDGDDEGISEAHVEGDDVGEDEEDEWDNVREDESMSRKPAWRRPSPNWIYFFITGATLSMGMGLAPKSELYINLACLVHPPQQRQMSESAPAILSMIQYDHDQMRLNTSLPDTEMGHNMPIDKIISGPLSPADEWFLKLQREIYEHSHHVSVRAPSEPNPSKPPNEPSDGPLPPSTPPPGSHSNNGTTHDTPYHEIDPRMCKKDPNVQAAAAKLTMTITLTSGILAALTTGYWGQTSDRLGRRKVMAVVVLGLFLSELCFVLVATFPYLVPGGYRALLIGPAIDGLLGGFSTITATVSAYISDTTPDGSRATVFARMSGIMMIGFAIGPVLGSAVIQATGNIMVPFYINVCVHFTYLLLILLVLPESLSRHARQILQKTAQSAKDAAKHRERAEREWENATPLVEQDDPINDVNISGFSRTTDGIRHSKWRKRSTGTIKRFTKRIFNFLAPLAIFGPREKDDGRRDWNMTFVGGAMFLVGMLYGVVQVKTQFSIYSYGWTARELGPFMSLLGFSRAFVLLAAIPFIMRFVKPRFQATSDKPTTGTGPDAVERDTTSAPLLAEQTAQPENIGEGDTVPQKATSTHSHRSALLDLYTVRISIMLEIIPYALLALNPTATQFIILSTLVTFGSATGPTANSLALSLLPSSREAGRLFGALGVLQALGATIISPLMFGTLFASTVGWYAPTIFILATVLMIGSLTLFLFVRVGGEGGDLERGRSRKVKTVRNGRAAAPK